MSTLTPRTDEVTLFQGEDFAEEARLSAKVEQAVQSSSKASPRRIGGEADEVPEAVAEAAREYDEFVAEAKERGVTLRLTAVGRKKWREITAAHPPRKGEPIEYREDGEVVRVEHRSHPIDSVWGFNYEALGDDLVPAAILGRVEGDALAPFSDGEKQDFVDSLNDADFSRVYSAAVRLNTAQGPDPKAPLSELLDLKSYAT